jgi:hypothetical protein
MTTAPQPVNETGQSVTGRGGPGWDVSDERPVADALEQRQEVDDGAPEVGDPWFGDEALARERALDAAEGDEIDQRREVEFPEDFEQRG